jgi:hypothetical protein
MDSGSDGRNDRVAADVMRPKKTDSGLGRPEPDRLPGPSSLDLPVVGGTVAF